MAGGWRSGFVHSKTITQTSKMGRNKFSSSLQPTVMNEWLVKSMLERGSVLFGQSLCEKSRLFENFWHFFSPITYSISLPERDIHHTIQTRNRNMKIKLSLQCLSMSVSVWYKHKAFNLSFLLEKARFGQKFDAQLLV